MRQSDVLIAGGGIAGLTAAIGLARAGLTVRLCERATGFSEVGAGLQLSPNATAALAGLGLRGAVGREAVAPEDLVIRRWGEPAPLAGMPMNSGGPAAPFWVLRRADLLTALLDTARMLPSLTLSVGRQVVGAEQRAEAVIAAIRTDRGQSEQATARVLLAADGLWSAMRRAAGDAVQPAFLGYEAWRTLIPREAAPEFARAARVNLWLGRGAHAVHYPVAGGRMVNLVVVRGGHDGSEGWDRIPPEAAAEELARRAAPPLAALIASAPQWRTWPLFDRAPAEMAKGRIAFVGDAAHPVLPFLAQGASMAIEDAAMLSRLLPAALADPRPAAVGEALQAYAAARRPRVARVQAAARGNGRVYHAGFPLAPARDMALRWLGPDGMARRYRWLYDWRDRA